MYVFNKKNKIKCNSKNSMIAQNIKKTHPKILQLMKRDKKKK